MRRLLFLFLLVPVFCKDIKRPALWLSLFQKHGNIGVITTDYSAGGRFYTMDSSGILSMNYTAIHSDATGFFLDNRVIIINRLNRDTVMFLDPGFFYRTTLEFRTGNRTNPHGIAFYRDKAYITLYETNYLLVVDKNTGIEIRRISLENYTERQSYFLPDGIPEASGIINYKDKIYVALQRLDRTHPRYIFPPADYSLLLELDPERDEVTAAYRLLYTNPVSKLKLYNLTGEDCIFMAGAGYLGFQFRLDGGIEAFCPESKRQFTVLTEEEAGGDILDFVIRDSSTGYASLSFEDLSTAIIEFHPATGTVTKTIAKYKNTVFASGLELDSNGNLYIGENAAFPLLRIYHTGSGVFLQSIPLPQYPFEIFRIEP